MADSITVAAGGPDRDRDALAAAQGLTDSLDAMAGELRAVNARQDRTRKIVAGLVVSLCLDLLITAGFGYNTVRVNGAQDATHTSEVSACQQANVNRAEDIAIWNRFLGDIAPPGAPQTAKVKAELAEINKLIKTKDMPRNCVALYAK